MSTTLESVFRPTPPQESFLRSSAKIRGYGGAMGGGKSRTVCEDKFDEMLDFPGIRVVIAREAHTSIIETTRKTMLEQVIPSALIAHKKQSGGEDYIELFNGSRCHFIGLDDPYRWYSAEIGSIAFDECQEIQEEKVVRLLTRLRQPGMPHRATFGFNPENPGHWLQRWFILGAQQTEHGFRKQELFATGATHPIGDCEFIFARATDNPHLPPGYVDATLAGLPEHLKRRYLEGLWEFISGLCYFDAAALMHYEEMAREARTVFQGSTEGDVVEDAEWRRQGRTRDRDDPVRLRRGDGPLMIWRLPEPGHRYVIAIDVSSGGSYDYSGMQVVDVDTFEQAAEWQGKADPDLVAQEAYRIGRLYNDALAAPEITGGWGFTIDQELKRLRYPKLFTRTTFDRIAKRWTDRTGWDTTQRSRFHMLDTLERVLREKEFGLYSLRAVSELGTFVYTDKSGQLGKPEAQPGCNDDLVMSLAIAVTIAVSSPKQLRQPSKPPPAYPWQQGRDSHRRRKAEPGVDDRPPDRVLLKRRKRAA